ncbi:MAG: Ig-like domain-containing protein [Gemmatimonadota bacterium]|nr:Ig-like domain-containing protein [Gemmatimonadota bacterium]
MRRGLLSLTLLTACGGLTATADGATFLDVVRPASTTLETGATLQLQAIARDARGEPVAAAITWAASDPFLTIDPTTGLLTAVATGTGGRVQASTGTGSRALYSEVLLFTVVAPVPPSPTVR